MIFDFNRVAWSLRDSYYRLYASSSGICLQTLEDRTKNRNLFFMKNTEEADVHVQEDKISIVSEHASYAWTFYQGFYAVLKGNAPLVLHYDDNTAYRAHTAVQQDHVIHICDTKTNAHIWLYAKQGQIYLNAEWKPGQIHSGDVSICIEPEGSDFEVVIYKTYSIGTPRLSCPDFEQCCAEKRADFSDWSEKMGARSDIDREMAFVLWQSIVAPLGNYKEETILCNKEGMNAVWSWDNCFHALGVAKAFPALAFYQLQLVYDNLDADGAMPDTICPFGVERGFTKPPVHAFIYAILMKLHPYFCERTQIERIYPAMRRNFFWWLHGRQNAPIYWHGNESGADNATCFDRYPHIQSPDLYAMLSCTADLLSTFAETLDDSTSAASYHAHAVQLAEEAEARFYDGKQFFVRPMDDGSPLITGSLLPQQALAAKYLTPGCKKQILSLLRSDFLGEYGLTSEAFASEKHLDGQHEAYWRGSVWGCQQVILARAAELAGDRTLGKMILSRYKNALQKGGASENSNSYTGEGNCGRAYCWSAAVWFFDL